MAATYSSPNVILTQGFQQPTNTKRKLNLVLFLEGLYSSNGLMNKVMNGGFPKWGADTAERITVELHSSAVYSNIVFSDTNVFLLTNGQAFVELPISISGSYYVTVKNWKTMETVSNQPLSFSGTADLNYHFHTSASQAYGNNMKNINGTWVLYTGDIASDLTIYPTNPIQDGLIDINDVYYIFSSNLNGDIGYHVSDLDGNGTVDIDDVYLVYINNNAGVIKVTP